MFLKFEDISKFDWLDLDFLSKFKVDSVEVLDYEEEKNVLGLLVEDFWDVVFFEERLLVSCYLERKVNGKFFFGVIVIRS